jgi:putative phosphoesterase
LKIPNLLAVQGNNDNYLIGYLARSILLDEFAKEDTELNFLKNMPEYLEIEIDGKSFGIFHGGPSNHFGQRIYEETVLDEKMISKYDYLLLGHTHERLLRKVGKTVIINPGSLGSPRDESGNSYCILDIASGKAEFKNV